MRASHWLVALLCLIVPLAFLFLDWQPRLIRIETANKEAADSQAMLDKISEDIKALPELDKEAGKLVQQGRSWQRAHPQAQYWKDVSPELLEAAVRTCFAASVKVERLPDSKIDPLDVSWFNEDLPTLTCHLSGPRDMVLAGLEKLVQEPHAMVLFSLTVEREKGGSWGGTAEVIGPPAFRREILSGR